MAGKNKIADSAKGMEEGSHHRFSHLYLFLFILLSIGLFLRLLLLGQSSYWIDEIVTIRDAITQGSIADVIRTDLNRFVWYHCLPFLLVVQRVFIKMVGFSGPFPPEWASRLPFALLGTASLPLSYLLGKSVRDRNVGMWTMFLVTFSVFHVFYSREAYSYSLLIFFALGTLWTGIQLIQLSFDNTRRRWAFALGYMFFSSGLLQSHLSALLFLAPWNVLMASALIRKVGWRALLRGPRLCFWVLTFGMAYLLFLPFLLRLFSGYTTTDSASAVHFSWSVIPTLLGRMGWGESSWTLLPFILFLAIGFFNALRYLRKKHDLAGILIALQLVLYFVLQSWMINRTQSRFEVKYYSALFPLLIVLTAMGIAQAVSWIGCRVRRIPLMAVRIALIVILLGWLSPSLWLVVNYKTRGNYKAIAKWINENLPDNAIYAFINVYELRGVPAVYPTPGRYGSFPAVWSTTDDYARLHVRERLLSFFQRFPLAVFVEPCPVDLLGPPPAENETRIEPLPRSQMFARQEWLEDKCFQTLVSLKTYPLGEVQWTSALIDRVLISYNKPEDLPVLARKRGEKFYHYFGPNWRYLKDAQWNDWRYIERSGIIVAGNATGKEQIAKLTMKLMSQPCECRLSVFGSNGSLLAQDLSVKPEIQDLTIPNIILSPGDNRIELRVKRRESSRGSLFLYSCGLSSDTSEVSRSAP